MKKFYLLCTSVMLVAFSLFQLSAKAVDRITINLEPGGHNGVKAESLQLAIKGTHVDLGTITKIEITGGELNADDWTYLVSVKDQLTSLTDFISGASVTISGAFPEKKIVLPKSLQRVTMMTITELPERAFQSYGELVEINFPAVTTLGVFTFSSCQKLVRATFGDGLKSLPEGIFQSCESLTDLAIPGVTAIGKSSLARTGLVSFENDNITSLGESAFADCQGLKHVRLNGIETIPFYALSQCPLLEDVIALEVTTLGESALYGCSALKIAVFPKLTTLGDYAVSYCDVLTHIALGATPPTAVGAGAFEGAPTPRTLIIVNDQGEPLRGGEYAKAVALYDPGKTNLWEGWNIGSENYYKISAMVDQGDGAVSVPAYGEAGSMIKLVAMPGSGQALLSATYTPEGGSAQAITGGSFEMPNAKVEVHVTFGPNSLTLHINGDNSVELTGNTLENALQGQTLASLTQIEVSSGKAFTESDWKYLEKKSEELTSLTQFTIAEGVDLVASIPIPDTKSFNSSVLGRYVDRSLLFPEGIEMITVHNLAEVTQKAFAYLPHLSHVTLPDATTVGEKAFIGCVELVETSLPKLEKVGYESFADNAKLTSIGASTMITAVGESAFNGCAALISIDLTNTESIGESAFEGCKALTEVSAPMLEILSRYAFSSCAALTKVDMPKVTEVQTSALSSCSALTTAILPMLAKIDNSAFFECTELASLTLGATPPTVEDKGAFAQIQQSANKRLLLVQPDGTPLSGQALVDAIAVYKAADDEGIGDEYWYSWAIPVAYTVSVSTTVENGTIEIAPSPSVEEATEVTLTPKPSDPAKYRIKEGSLKAYKADDENVMITITDGKFQMPAYNVTVTVMFEEISIPTPVSEASYSFSIYPNPATTTIQIHGLQKPERVRIYNVIGEPVLDLLAQENEPIDISTLRTGLYIVHVNNESYRLIVR